MNSEVKPIVTLVQLLDIEAECLQEKLSHIDECEAINSNRLSKFERLITILCLLSRKKRPMVFSNTVKSLSLCKEQQKSINEFLFLETQLAIRNNLALGISCYSITSKGLRILAYFMRLDEREVSIASNSEL